MAPVVVRSTGRTMVPTVRMPTGLSVPSPLRSLHRPDVVGTRQADAVGAQLPVTAFEPTGGRGVWVG